MSDRTRKVLNIILALAVSLAAWVFVVYNYDPMIKEKYTGIPIKYTGLDNLAGRGYAVTETKSERVDVVLEQKRIDTGSITADDISITADVSNLASGLNTVYLQANGPDGTTVREVSLRTVTINIESADSEDMEIAIEYPDTAEQSAEPIVEDMNYTTATVVATEDRLANVDRVAAVIDPNDLGEKMKPLTVELAALDKEGNKVLNVVVYPEAVSFKAAAGYIKTVKLYTQVVDDSNDNYERTYTAPDTIMIKGSRDIINRTGSITANEIDVSGYYEDTEIPLTFDLPEGIYLAKGYEEQMLKLKVTEKAEEEDEDEDSGSSGDSESSENG